MADAIGEKCAVAGIIDDDAAVETALALQIMENRGSAATGIGGLTGEGEFRLIREAGAAGDVWDKTRIAHIGGWGLTAAVGHNRYATSGRTDSHYQPARHGDGDKHILLGDNGNLSNMEPLISDSLERGIDIGGINDSETKTRAIADRVERGASLPDAIADVYPLLVGAFSTVVLGKGANGEPVLAAFRDRHGVRPMALGETATGFMVASETVGLEVAGAKFVRDVRPGELLTITHDGLKSIQLADPDPKFDMFELIYFSRPDSKFHDTPISEIRRAFGRQLAREYRDYISRDSLVVGVPASAIPYGEGFAEEIGLDYCQVITKNPEVGRSFMAPTQQDREALRDRKYIFKGSAIFGRALVVIDDSIVRNTTARFITRKLLYEYGAASVTILSGSPPVRYPNFYGIDMPDQEHLAAARMDIGRMRELIGAQSLGYLSLDGMLQAVYEATGQVPDNFELSCFTGDYPIDIGSNSHNIRRLADAELAA